MEQIIQWSARFQVRIQRFISRQRMFIVLLHGFSSGLPLALSGATLQAWFTMSGVDIVTIGILTLAGQPYVYKFLWAPVLDRYSTPWLGRRRGWIFIMQLFLALVLALMSFFEPAISPWYLGCLALVLASFSATQDIAVDAYRTDLLDSQERGLGTAMYTTGYRVAALLSGGLALVLAAVVGWKFTYLLMAVLMLICALFTITAPRIEKEYQPRTLQQAVVEPFKEFLSRRAMLFIMVFIVLYKLGDAFTLSLSTTFLLRGIGFSLMDLGVIYKTVGMFATLGGTFLGGMLMRRISLYQALLYFGVLQAISSGTFMVLAIVGKHYGVMISAIFLENFCGGLGTIAFVAFLMGLCDHRYTATQYALFSALASIGRVFVGPISGVMVTNIGWTQFYFWSVILGIPSLIVLGILRKLDVFKEESI